MLLKEDTISAAISMLGLIFFKKLLYLLCFLSTICAVLFIHSGDSVVTSGETPLGIFIEEPWKGVETVKARINIDCKDAS